MKRGKLRKGVVRAAAAARDSFWLVPLVQSLVAGGLAVLTLWLDERIWPGLGDDVTWLFGGTADGASTLLQVIAGSLITVISVVFSITLIAIQQASAQYSPRLLRNFTSDRANQMVLGTYVATFIYALLILRKVRESTEDADAFIPALSLFLAIVLAVISLAMLIFFIHHITESLQLPYLLQQIRRELDAEIDRQFPETFGMSSIDPTQATALVEQARRHEQAAHLRTISCREEGYLRSIQEKEIEEALRGLSAHHGVHLAEVPVCIGQYLRRGTALLRVWSATEVPGDVQERLESAFDLGRQRSVAQDPLFGIEQMADVAIKALSPSINDPTTATQALDQIAAAVSLLQSRELPSPARQLGPQSMCVFAAPDFADFIEASFGRIVRAARNDVSVQLHLLHALGALAQAVPSPKRASALRHQLAELLSQAEQSSLGAHDKQRIRQRGASVMQALRDRVAPSQ
jgi:uncharacterized membrane protein